MRLRHHFAAWAFAVVLALPVHAADWGQMAIVSSTLGVDAGRLCVGASQAGRPSDMGCPTYAPFVSSGGLLTGSTASFGGLTVTGSASMTTVSATNISATYVDATRNGTVSATYGYFSQISGSIPASMVTGMDAAARGDRISTTGVADGSGLAMVATDGNVISFTTSGVNTAYLDSSGRYIGPGVSITTYNGVSSTNGYFSGNVGIGTTAPTKEGLTISGTSTPGLRVQASNAWDFFTSAVGGRLGIYDATNSRELMTFRTSGKVGVSNTSPVAQFDVTGTISASDIVQVGSTTTIACGSGLEGGIRYTNVSDTLQICTSGGWKSLVSGTVANTTTGTGTTNYVARWTGTSTLGTGILYDDATNVGVGTSTPTARLEVSGTFRVARNTTSTDTCDDGSLVGTMRANPTTGMMELCAP
ncbi:MAG: hypothetical protein WAZ18_01730 [Alphaproteobacteria bacterium]